MLYKANISIRQRKAKNQEAQRFMEEENPWKLGGSDFFMQKKKNI